MERLLASLRRAAAQQVCLGKQEKRHFCRLLKYRVFFFTQLTEN